MFYDGKIILTAPMPANQLRAEDGYSHPDINYNIIKQIN